MGHHAVDRSSRQWLHDMYREIEKEGKEKRMPGTDRNTCKCGHTFAKHYPLTQAMPCSMPGCRCDWCTAPVAEEARRNRKRMGAPEVPPLPRVFRGGK
jgi:hypothetical protein